MEGGMPTNCAFGHKGSGKLYGTEFGQGRMEVFDVDTDGFPLYTG